MHQEKLKKGKHGPYKNMIIQYLEYHADTGVIQFLFLIFPLATPLRRERLAKVAKTASLRAYKYVKLPEWPT